MTPRITPAKFRSIDTKLAKLQAEISTLTTGNVRAADSLKIDKLRDCRELIADARAVIEGYVQQ